MSKNTLPRAKSSKRAPFIPDEPGGERHARRLRIALEDADRIAAQLAGVATTITRHNNGAHWKIRCAGKLVEWWPQTGRVVIDQAWGKVRKAHDVDQLVAIIRKVCRLRR